MGARPSSYKKSGGFLNGVDCVITDYQLTDEFNGEPYKPGKIKGSDGKLMDRPHSLNVLLSVRVDGAEEDTTTTLKAAGEFDAWEVSEDGHTVTPVEDGLEFSANAAFSKFMASLCNPSEGKGFPEELLPEDTFNFEAIIGTRLRLVQQTDIERTKKFGKRVDKKTGKSFDRQDLVVEQVYELPAGSSSGVKAAKGKVAAAPKGKAKAVEPEGDDLDQLAKDTLVEILAAAKGNTIAKSKLSMAVLTKLMKHPQREDVRKLIFTDDFLTQEDGWSFDKAKQVVSA